MTNVTLKELSERLVSTAQKAGRLEMEVYQEEFDVDIKGDNSPVTKADQLAEKIILEDLAAFFPQIPVIAEEAASTGILPQIHDRFFLVDPLDGTKEFIKKSHEFTVNIALIENGHPIFGLVYAPALKQIYITVDDNKAIMAELDPFDMPKALEDLDVKIIETRTQPQGGLTVVASKSHMTTETQKFIDQYQVSDLQSAGSSLKFCLLARGDADLYPRFGLTMEWDTAAGHAVLQAAGGSVLTVDNKEFLYGKTQDNYLNPFFICWAHKKKSL